MNQLTGRCHCESSEVIVQLSKPASEYGPRKCDCSFCVKQGAAYVSDPGGSVHFKFKGPVNRYRQTPESRAEFLLCVGCGVLLGVNHQTEAGTFAAVNASVFYPSPFAKSVDVSPHLLSAKEKSERWASVWFSSVQIETQRDLRTPRPSVVRAKDVPPRTKPSNYPEPFKSRMGNRVKTQLGDVFGLKNFGVNLTKLKPGGESALLHKHTKQDEFIFILEGEPTLVDESGEFAMTPGMCAGFQAEGLAHQLVNRTTNDVVYLEIGDRTPGDEGLYPRDDLKAQLGQDGSWTFTKKDGVPY